MNDYLLDLATLSEWRAIAAFVFHRQASLAAQNASPEIREAVQHVFMQVIQARDAVERQVAFAEIHLDSHEEPTPVVAGSSGDTPSFTPEKEAPQS